MKRRGLGKGLEALLGDNINLKQDNDKADSKNSVSIKYLKQNPYQPRKDFDKDALDKLAQSIKQYGIIQPIAVRDLGKNDYEIIAGERRFLAAKQIGLKKVPIVIHNIDNKESATFALIENIQREDLNAIEKAQAQYYYPDHRTVIIHGQTIRKDQIKRAAALGVDASLFPMHTFIGAIGTRLLC